MAAKKTPDFNLGTVTLGRVDGTGDPVTVPFPPSAYIRAGLAAKRGSELATISPGYIYAYFALQTAGKLEELGIPDAQLDDIAALEAAVLEMFDRYALALETVDGDGEGGGDPTLAS